MSDKPDLSPASIEAEQLQQMRTLLESIWRKASQKDSIELLELSERCMALVDEMMKAKKN